MVRPASFDPATITAVILAGGKGRRMHGVDKGLIPVSGGTLTRLVADRLVNQVQWVLISANRHIPQYRQLGFPVIQDEIRDFQGPLSGITAALKKTRTPFLLTAPCDSPLIPANLAERLFHQLNASGADIAVVHDGIRLHPLFCLMKRSLSGSLQAYLETGQRRAEDWIRQNTWIKVDFSDMPEAFFNVNEPAALSILESRLSDSR